MDANETTRCEHCSGTGNCPACLGHGEYTPDVWSATSEVTIACPECEVYRNGYRTSTGKCSKCEGLGREMTLEEATQRLSAIKARIGVE